MDALAIRPDEEDSDRSLQRPAAPKAGAVDARKSSKLAEEIIGKMTEAKDGAELDAISKAEMTAVVKPLLTPQDLKSITDAYKALYQPAKEKK